MRHAREYRFGKAITLGAMCFALLLLAGCGGSGGGGADPLIGGASGGGTGGGGDTPPATPPTALNQAGFDGIRYTFGHSSIPTIPFTGAPADTDYTRWAMLDDGATYRLYFFRKDTSSIYQFGFNPSTATYEHGYNSIPEIEITNMPADANTASFKMLHDGVTYRLYMRSLTDPRRIYQAGFNGVSYEYGHSSTPEINTTNLPADADLTRWAMLHDGGVYRQYVAKAGST